MVQYLKDFICQYEIDGALLEGKVEWLVNIIQMQCVDMIRAKQTYF
jgi:hypothetical protein